MYGRIAVAALLVLLAAAVVSAGAAPPVLQRLVYEVVAVREGGSLGRDYLVVEPLGGKGRYLRFNITYLTGELVRVRDVHFIRPRSAASVVVKVDAETWEAYYGDLRLGSFLFIGLGGDSAPVSSLEDGRVVYWSVVNFTLMGEVSGEGYWVPAAQVKLSERVRVPQAYLDVARALGLERLKVYGMRLRGPRGAFCDLVFEGEKGVLLFATFSEVRGIIVAEGGRVSAYTNVTLFKLLGVKGVVFYLNLVHVSPGRSSVLIAEKVEVDPVSKVSKFPGIRGRRLPVPV